MRDLELDLFKSQTIMDKCRSSEVYSQNLYAAMCNNLFYYGEEVWSCSWRYAGGIVSDIRQEGDYMNWYCSGKVGKNSGYVGESFVTDEIRNDLLSIGWVIKPYEETN